MAPVLATRDRVAATGEADVPRSPDVRAAGTDRARSPDLAVVARCASSAAVARGAGVAGCAATLGVAGGVMAGATAGEAEAAGGDASAGRCDAAGSDCFDRRVADVAEPATGFVALDAPAGGFLPTAADAAAAACGDFFICPGAT